MHPKHLLEVIDSGYLTTASPRVSILGASSKSGTVCPRVGWNPSLPAIGCITARPTLRPPSVLGLWCVDDTRRAYGLLNERDHFGSAICPRRVLHDLAPQPSPVRRANIRRVPLLAWSSMEIGLRCPPCRLHQRRAHQPRPFSRV